MRGLEFKPNSTVKHSFKLTILPAEPHLLRKNLNLYVRGSIKILIKFTFHINLSFVT